MNNDHINYRWHIQRWPDTSCIFSLYQPVYLINIGKICFKDNELNKMTRTFIEINTVLVKSPSKPGVFPLNSIAKSHAKLSVAITKCIKSFKI